MRRMLSRTGSTFTSERRLIIGVLFGFLGVALFAAIDIWVDLREGVTLAHVAAEAGILLAGLLGSIVMAHQLVLVLRRARAAEEEAHQLAKQLDATRAEASQWRSEARDLMRGLAVALDQQFVRWHLSPAEKEVALLLLKGLSHKDIAQIRSVSEATARQQARAIYKKGGLSGRHDLAAFFLEDLMLPVEPGDQSAQQDLAI
jgi:DNA-binding CsgD family transcriptional regulator